MNGGASTIPILTYHSLDDSASVVSVSPRTFAEQMAILADSGLTGITLKQAVDHRTAHGAWPRRSVVLTFDDGFASVHEHAVAPLKAHHFAATVFLIADHMGGRNDWAPPPPGLGEQPILSWSQAKDLASAGFEPGAHTKTHPDLRGLNPEQLKDELEGSRRMLEDRLGQGMESFAYPYGLSNTTASEMAGRAFRTSCTTVLRRASSVEALNRLPRIDVFYFREPARFRALVAGGQEGYLTVRRWGRGVRSMLVG